MRRFLPPLLGLVLFALGACGPRTEPYATAPRPKNDSFGSAVPAGHTSYDNDTLAALFVQLTHGLENGDFRRGLQRFEEPVNVGMIGPGAAEYRPFLKMLVDEIAREAAVPISAGVPPYNLLVRFVPGEEFLPNTINQCWVVFGQPDWATLQRDPGPYGGGATRKIIHQTEMSVIIPDTIEPYKVRECLLEEITQALGTANDLYGLASTIFNDDNAHSWPTRLDYLMLRLLYNPDMASGLTQEETGKRALKLLDTLNPDGRGAPALPRIEQRKFSKWRQGLHAQGLIEDAVQALRVARRLAEKAHHLAPGSAYECSGVTFLAGTARKSHSSDREELVQKAIDLCSKVHGSDDVRIALLRLQRAYGHLDAGRYRKARSDADAIIPVFLGHALDGSLAAAYIVQTTAAWRLDDPKWDTKYLPRAAAWSAFAFGDDHELTARLRPY